jgi:hypothetical protein
MKNVFLLALLFSAAGYAVNSRRGLSLSSSSDESGNEGGRSYGRNVRESKFIDEAPYFLFHLQSEDRKKRRIGPNFQHSDAESVFTENSSDSEHRLPLLFAQKKVKKGDEYKGNSSVLFFILDHASRSFWGVPFSREGHFVERILQQKIRIDSSEKYTHLEAAIEGLADGSPYSLGRLHSQDDQSDFQEIDDLLKDKNIECPEFLRQPKDLCESISNIYHALRAWAKHYFSEHHQFLEGEREKKTLAGFLQELISIHPPVGLKNNPFMGGIEALVESLTSNSRNVNPTIQSERARLSSVHTNASANANEGLEERHVLPADYQVLKDSYAKAEVSLTEEKAKNQSLLQQLDEMSKKVLELENKISFQHSNHEKEIEELKIFNKSQESELDQVRQAFGQIKSALEQELHNSQLLSASRNEEDAEDNESLKQRVFEQSLVINQCKLHINEGINSFMKVKNNLELCVDLKASPFETPDKKLGSERSQSIEKKGKWKSSEQAEVNPLIKNNHQGALHHISAPQKEEQGLRNSSQEKKSSVQKNKMIPPHNIYHK